MGKESRLNSAVIPKKQCSNGLLGYAGIATKPLNGFPTGWPGGTNRQFEESTSLFVMLPFFGES